MPETRPGSESRMPENPGTEPAESHGEAGTAGETVQVVRRDAAEHEQHEARPAADAPPSDAATQIGWGCAYITGRYGQQEITGRYGQQEIKEDGE